MSKLATRIVLGLLIATCCFSAASAPAQQAPPQTQRQPSAPPAGAPAASPAADANLKREILSSDRWKKTLGEFDQWLSVQIVYTPQQVQQLKARLAAEVQNMSGAELQQFMNQWDAKLKALMGQDATEARQWLGQYMSTMAAGYRRQFLQSLGPTDVANMSAAQIEQRADDIRALQLNIQQQSAASNSIRRSQVQSQMQANASTQQAVQRDLGSQPSALGAYPSYHSSYNPAPQPFSNVNVDANPMKFYMDSDTGQVIYSIP